MCSGGCSWPSYLQDGVVVQRQPGAGALCLCSAHGIAPPIHTALPLPQAGSNRQLYSCTSTCNPIGAHGGAGTCVNTYAHWIMRSSPDEVHCSRRLAKHVCQSGPDVQTEECSKEHRAEAATPIESLRTQPYNPHCVHRHRDAAISCSCRACTPRSGQITPGLQGWFLRPCAHVCSTAC